jgi:peroxiredoxin Q/BCP
VKFRFAWRYDCSTENCAAASQNRWLGGNRKHHYPVMNDMTQTKQKTERKDLLAIGEDAPEFRVRASNGGDMALAAFRGTKNVVLVFYPGDNTPVCTAQLCGFRDSWDALKSADTVVFGVNPASEVKHGAFVAKHRFPFPLLVDSGSEIAAQYGCRALFGIVKRTVYVIDKAGKIVYAKRGNPAPSEVLTSVVALRNDTQAGA